MAVKTVSIKQLGRNYKISSNFKLAEMACKNGADTVKYSTELMAKLEELRAYVGGTIGINSGYRTTAYNKQIGGATGSLHTKGTAADIVVKKDGQRVSAKLICCLCVELGFGGVALISDYAVHVDVRTGSTYRGDERKGYGNNVKNGDFYTYFGIKPSQVTALKAKPAVVEPVKPAEPVKKEEEEMTQEQFNKMMDVWIAERSKLEPADWSKEARAWAEKDENGQALIQGTGTGQAYQMFMTREQMITILHRLVKRWM